MAFPYFIMHNKYIYTESSVVKHLPHGWICIWRLGGIWWLNDTIFHLMAIIYVSLSSTIPFSDKIHGRLFLEKMCVSLANSMSLAKCVFDFGTRVNMNSEVVWQHIYFTPLQYIPLFPAKILHESFRYIDRITTSNVFHHSELLSQQKHV